MRLRELTLQLKRFVSRRLPSSEVWPAQIAEIDTMDPPSKQITPRRPSGSGPSTATKVREFFALLSAVVGLRCMFERE